MFFYSILDSTELSDSEKFNLIQSNSEFDDVEYAMSNYLNFTSNHAYLANLIDQTGDEGNIFLSNKLFYDLGFRPKAGCEAYDAAINNCLGGFVACCAAGIILTGPAAAVSVAVCGLPLLTCVNSADASYPSCLPSGNIFLQNWILLHQEDCAN
ncbi:MAG: hypothetical protein FGM41_01970 [Bacteroidetes bacterium]|nr:hypothetical protein [Bacteroidota bacterium]